MTSTDIELVPPPTVVYQRSEVTQDDVAQIVGLIEASWPWQAPLPDDSRKLLVIDIIQHGDPDVWREVVMAFRHKAGQRFMPSVGELLAEWRRLNLPYRQAQAEVRWRAVTTARRYTPSQHRQIAQPSMLREHLQACRDQLGQP